jgi:hypothetical protein
MAKREIEGDWIYGWPDRKRAAVIAGKDAEGRTINGLTPLADLEGLITPTDAYYIVNQLEVPDPVHPSDWTLEIVGGERPISLTLEDLLRLPGRTVRRWPRQSSRAWPKPGRPDRPCAAGARRTGVERRSSLGLLIAVRQGRQPGRDARHQG